MELGDGFLVLSLLHQGLGDRAAGLREATPRRRRLLCINAKTVDNNRTHLIEKLGVHSFVELIRYAAHPGLLA